jgi:hypothetical protein
MSLLNFKYINSIMNKCTSYEYTFKKCMNKYNIKHKPNGTIIEHTKCKNEFDLWYECFQSQIKLQNINIYKNK